MAYNRTFAKARAIRRCEDRKALATIPQSNTLSSWGAEMPPYSPRCRSCGVRTVTSTTRCPVCGATL